MSNSQRRLIFVVAEQSALLKILTTDAMPCPRNCIEALFRQGFSAMNTLPVTSRFNALQRFIDQIQQLPIVVRHRHQQLFCISVGSHVRRILRRFRIALATVKFCRLHLTDQPFAAAQQFVSEDFRSPLIHYLF